MAEEAIPQEALAAPSAETTVPARPEAGEAEAKDATASKGPENGEAAGEDANAVATSEANAPPPVIDTKEPNDTNGKKSPAGAAQDKPAANQEGVEMKEKDEKQEGIKADDAAPAPSTLADQETGATASAGASKARRKSGGVPEHKSKKLNKKASKAKMTHTDAKPGDYFMARLKGYPPWPAVICDESMLPSTLLKTRPVTAAGPDGTYRADYEDGGSKAKDRTFPVMYLHTNEFGWIPNTDLSELDFDTVADVPTTVRKDLYAAHQLAAERHDLDYFKQILKNFMEQRAAELEAKEAAKAAKKAAKTKKQSKVTVHEDEDVEMADATAELDSEEAEAEKPKKSKKRKAEEDGTTDSAKKPKTVLKLTNTPKATSTPKTPKDQSASKGSKPKKKAAPKPKEPEFVAPKEPELTPEEKRVKKEKEILFLRHRLQKGLLVRDQDQKEEDMKSMSEFISKLEGYADLEVSIIRATKINKVLKAILKLNTILKEEEFNFKARSQALLDKWNKLLAVDQDVPAPTNGVKQDAKPEAEASSAGAANGVEKSASDEKPEEATEAAAPEATKAAEADDAAAPATEENPKESVTETAAVESTT